MESQSDVLKNLLTIFSDDKYITENGVNGDNASVSPAEFQVEEAQVPPSRHEKMRSGLFLVLHTIAQTILLSSCAIYISATRELSLEADNALVLSQIWAVVPGKRFTDENSKKGIKVDSCRP